jgi:hypothetical protein
MDQQNAEAAQPGEMEVSIALHLASASSSVILHLHRLSQSYSWPSQSHRHRHKYRLSYKKGDCSSGDLATHDTTTCNARSVVEMSTQFQHSTPFKKAAYPIIESHGWKHLPAPVPGQQVFFYKHGVGYFKGKQLFDWAAREDLVLFDALKAKMSPPDQVHDPLIIFWQSTLEVI